jgi:hypothetical protein
VYSWEKQQKEGKLASSSKGYVYMVWHTLLPQSCYIGSATDLIRRVKQHLHAITNDLPKKLVFHSVFHLLLDIDCAHSIHVEILQEVEGTRSELYDIEREWIAFVQPDLNQAGVKAENQFQSLYKDYKLKI